LAQESETSPSPPPHKPRVITPAVLVLLPCLVGGLVWWLRVNDGAGPESMLAAKEERIAPVEVAPIERGSIAFERTYSGTLEATAEFEVAPKISGRIERLLVDLADPVSRGQLIAELDDREYVQAVAQADADLAVAKATLAEADSTLTIAKRELVRTEDLRKDGVASESQYDAAKTAQLAGQARLEVARAQLQRAESSLESAKIRLTYTKVNAEWNDGDSDRVVAERFVDEGDTVSANEPLFSIVDLSPITGTIYVTERDYGQIALDQAATLVTDAFPSEPFSGHVVRISPVFRQESRQARVELRVDNPAQRLKPGMFIRVTLELAREEQATIVPEGAIASRGETTGLFVVNKDGTSVSWHPVRIGLRADDRVQVFGEGLDGLVVTLGQQLLEDGAAIRITNTDDGGADH
jgi:RND family efflux transporter MFP subunit